MGRERDPGKWFEDLDLVRVTFPSVLGRVTCQLSTLYVTV